MSNIHKIIALEQAVTELQRETRANHERAKQWPCMSVQRHRTISINTGLYRAIELLHRHIKHIKGLDDAKK